MKRRLTQSARSASSDAEDWLAQLGMELPGSPKTDVPTLPDDLTEISDADLMEVFSEFTEWANYANGRRSALEIDEADAQAQLDIANARAVVSGWDDNDGKSDKRVTIAKARREIDTEVQQASERYRKVHAKKKMVTAMCDIFERNAALISRELSRRIGSGDVERRSARWRA